MGKLFNSSKVTGVSQQKNLESRYNGSINNLLLIIAFTVINIVLLVTNANRYFLFSAFIPYFLADYGMYFCGMYPEEYYSDVPDMQFSDQSLFVTCLVIAAIIIVIYFVCWFFARKKKVGWLIAALVLFIIDTVAMFVLMGIDSEMIIDVVFHGWVIFSFINGIINYNKLKALPAEDIVCDAAEDESTEQYTYAQAEESSRVIRMADNAEKARTLLEAEVPGYHIVYRRVKKTNELVVNGMVYDEYEALVEFPHTLIALIDGHKIEVQYDTSNHMYIIFDGNQLAKKLRLI